PTGKEIAEKAGVSSKETLFSLPWIGDVSPAGAAGLAIDISADPTNLIPGAALARGVGQAAKGGARLAGKAAEATTKAVVSPLAKTSLAKASSNVARGAKLALDKLFNPK